MSNQDKKEIVKSSKGRFFVVEFVKKDGSIRKMVARLGVKKGVKGTGKPLSEDSNIMRVFDVQKREFRSINLETLISFKCGATVFDKETEATEIINSLPNLKIGEIQKTDYSIVPNSYKCSLRGNLRGNIYALFVNRSGNRLVMLYEYGIYEIQKYK